MQITCEMCDFWELIRFPDDASPHPHSGECRLKPPAWFGARDREYCRFPTTYDDDWCARGRNSAGSDGEKE